MSERCPTCSAYVRIVSTGEGTHHYQPLDRDKPRDPFSSGVFVYAVDIGGEEVHLFAIRDHARAFAALFGDARVTEQPLLDGDYVDEVRADLEADRG